MGHTADIFKPVEGNRARPLPGFTLVEMLVAVGATMLLVLFLNQIFSSMSSGVATGAATSEIIETQLPLMQQIHDDAEDIVGPAEGGFLVLVQQQYNGVKLHKDDQVGTNVRSDQIAWIRPAGGLTSQVPASEQSYEMLNYGSAYARVWLGHVRKTGADGDATGDQLGIAGGENEIACNWVLGRQRMLLGWTTFPQIYIDPTMAGWPVAGYTAVSNPGIRDDNWWRGLSDIHGYTLANCGTYLAADPLLPQRAYDFVYATERLWCGPNPEPNAAGAFYPSWQLAQMHSYLLGNVSDFRIEFAGDYERLPGIHNDGIDMWGDTAGRKWIKWYSHFFNDPVSNTSWGSTPYNPNEPPTFEPLINTAASPTAFADQAASLPPFTPPNIPALYHHPGSVGFGPLPGATVAKPTATLVWHPAGGPGGLDVYWPNMIRFRYRVHDANGKLVGSDGRRGKVFEHIMYVKDVLGFVR